MTVSIVDCEQAGLINGPYWVVVKKDGKVIASHSGLSRTRAEQRQTELGDEWGIYGAGHKVTYLPHVCSCCGEETATGRDCCSDHFPEPGEMRETGR